MLSGTKMIRIAGSTDAGTGLTLYPNPVLQELRITIPASWQHKLLTYEIVNLRGQVLSRVQKNNSSQTEALNVQSLAAGNYFVLVKCEGQVISGKLVKQ